MGTCVAALLVAHAQLQTPAPAGQLLAAIEKGDLAAATALLDKGADVNATNNYWLTPLFVAADRANTEMVKLLLARGADPNRTEELMWGRTALTVAAVGTSGVKNDAARAEIVKLLVDKGAGTAGESLPDLIRGGHLESVRTILARGAVVKAYLNTALAAAKRARRTDAVELLQAAGAADPGPLDLPQSSERLKKIAGVYRTASGQQLTLRMGRDDQQLLLVRPDRDAVMLFPVELEILKSEDRAVVVTMAAGAVPPPQITLRERGGSEVFTRTADDAPTRTRTDTARTAGAAPSAPALPAGAAVGTKTAYRARWPSFRGPDASGVGDGANLPTTWDLEKSINIKWKTPIPGFSHSSPIIWDDRIYVTTAVPLGNGSGTFKHGEASGVASTTDDVPHAWHVYALDLQTGKLLWDRVAHEGIPKTQRHVMASQANATPATDGRHIVAFFGSEGLYCYDTTGKLVWQRDLGVLRANRILDASYEWNTASSPIIHKNLVILQLDLMEGSHIRAFDIDTGNDVWRTDRDEIPSWATPLVATAGGRTELITAAGKYARGYDPDTGKELWRLAKHSEFPTPSPIAGAGMIFVTSGTGSTVQPIYAIRPGAIGDISLKDDEESNGAVAWSKLRGGPSIPTPILYGDLLYVCNERGILSAYVARTGERVYQERLTRGGNYSASAVAADGKLYFASEDGDVIVVKAGEKFERLAVNPMGELMMATPAVAPNAIILRTQHQLVAVSESVAPPSR